MKLFPYLFMTAVAGFTGYGTYVAFLRGEIYNVWLILVGGLVLIIWTTSVWYFLGKDLKGDKIK